MPGGGRTAAHHVSHIKTTRDRIAGHVSSTAMTLFMAPIQAQMIGDTLGVLRKMQRLTPDDIVF